MEGANYLQRGTGFPRVLQFLQKIYIWVLKSSSPFDGPPKGEQERVKTRACDAR